MSVKPADEVTAVEPVEEPVVAESVAEPDENLAAKPMPTKLGKRIYRSITRKSRAPGAKTHEKKITKELEREMDQVFSRHFEVKPGACMHFSELLNAFTAFRNEGGWLVTDEEKNRFKLNGKRLFMAQWPNAECVFIRESFCYIDVARKTK